MEQIPNFTGVVPPESFSTGASVWKRHDTVAIAASKKELIETWFIEPLQHMSGHQAFVCLGICFFLYEKHLKQTGLIGPDETFSSGHKVFHQIGSDLGISALNAYEFWTCWRNGLAHHGMPKKSEKFSWGMTGEQKVPVHIDANTFTINPWLIRDLILKKVAGTKQIWRDELAPLMGAFKITNP